MVAAGEHPALVISPLIFQDRMVPWDALLGPGAEIADALRLTVDPLIGQSITTPGGSRAGEPIEFAATPEALVLPGPGAHAFVCRFGAFKVLARGHENDDEFAIAICRFISDNVVHSQADSRLCHTGRRFFVGLLLEKFFLSDQPLALHCGDIVCFTAYVLAQAGYRTRRVTFVNSPTPRGHILLELLLPECGKWVIVDPDYGIMLRDPDGNYVGSPQLDAHRSSVNIVYLSNKSWLKDFWNLPSSFRGQFTWTPEKSRATAVTSEDHYRRVLADLGEIALAEFVFLPNGEISITLKPSVVGQC